VKRIRLLFETVLVFLAVLLFFEACGKEKESSAGRFEVSPSTLTADAPGGQVAFEVTSTEDWMAVVDQSWAKLLTVKGTGSENPVTVRISVSENTYAEQRSATVTVSTLGGQKKTVGLIQAAGSGVPSVKGISSAEDLLAFAAAVNNGGAVSPFMVDGVVTLLCDIDASSIKEWIPVGTKDSPLSEDFDGKGHAIKNIRWTVDTEKYPDAGFIGYARNARISNLVFGSGGSVVTFSGKASGTIGGIVGNAVGVTLTGVTNQAALSVSAGSSTLCMGGICGKTDVASLVGDAESKKKACVNDGDISASFACFNAGLVGYNVGKILCCTNNGAVTGVASAGFGPAWGCAYNAAADRFTGNFGYGTVNGRASVHSTAVYPASAYNLEENTVDWTQDDYYDWTVLEEKQLHAGVKYSHCSFTGMPRHMHVLQIDLGNPEIELTTAYANEQVPNPNANKNSNNGKNLRETLSEVCSRRRSEGQKIIAGINTGFFDSNDGISRGYHIEEGEPVYINNPAVFSALANHSWALTVFTDGTASCGKKSLTATLEAGGSSYSISSVNDTILRHASAKYAVNMYTSRYKRVPHPSKPSITNPLARNVLYVVADYKDGPVKVNTGWAEAVVKAMHNGTGNPLSEVPYLSSAKEVGFAVSGSTAQALLSSLKPGDTVRLKFDMSIEGETKPIYTQNSSMYRLMENGQDGSNTPSTGNNLYTTYDPMTFPVVSQDRKTVWLVEVDGRQPEYSYGLKGYEMFRIARKLGGWNMTRFDGGGSSCMWVYDPSSSSGRLVNRVCDSKGERSCLNYMLVRLK
jgi:exopolysaccharide biosynthesis protein